MKEDRILALEAQIQDLQDRLELLDRVAAEQFSTILVQKNQRIEELSRLAYIDPEHQFPDSTWKHRCQEEVTRRRESEKAIGWYEIVGWDGEPRPDERPLPSLPSVVFYGSRKNLIVLAMDADTVFKLPPDLAAEFAEQTIRTAQKALKKIGKEAEILLVTSDIRFLRIERLERSPVFCEGEWTHTSNGSDFSCGYDAEFGCEDCIVNDGALDPRTGLRWDGEDEKDAEDEDIDAEDAEVDEDALDEASEDKDVS